MYRNQEVCGNNRFTMEHPRKIRCLTTLPTGIRELSDEASTDGFRFMDNLWDDWEKGANRFDCPGETFRGIFQGLRLLAVGGLNVDPYVAEAHTGRLRHVYVLKRVRRQGLASDIVRHLLVDARRSFRSVRLFTDTKDGAMFYEALGFMPSPSSTASHEISL
jgi:GNAT superfamily N-acetyltransferase